MLIRKTNWEEQKNRSQAIFYYIATILVLLAVIGMLTDFISWKNAIGLIKSKLPPGAKIEAGGGNLSYTPTWWGNLRGRVDIFSDEELNIQTRHEYMYPPGRDIILAGFMDGVVDNQGFTINLKQIDDWRLSGDTTIKSAQGEKKLHVVVYLIDKGYKVYNHVFVGYKIIDYPVTYQILKKYKPQIDPDNEMTNKDIAFLMSFTHDSLHKFVISFFEKGEVPELFSKPNIFAYRLDNIISSQVKRVKEYKDEWNDKRERACIGIIYTIDNKTYVQVHYDGYWIGCKGGGFVWSFWGKR